MSHVSTPWIKYKTSRNIQNVDNLTLLQYCDINQYLKYWLSYNAQYLNVDALTLHNIWKLWYDAMFPKIWNIKVFLLFDDDLMLANS